MGEINSRKFYTLAGLGFLIFSGLALILTFLGAFYASLLAAFGILFLAALGYLYYLNRDKIQLTREFLLVFAFILIFTCLYSFFTVPTIFSGRDQGTLSNAAIALSQNHKLAWTFPAQQEFFKIYGQGTALNFPGFNYDSAGNLVPHFPLGYISYLAAFYSFFGLFGLILANALAFLFFLSSFYLLAKEYLGTKKALMTLLLVLTSFIFSWIFKYTLSENLALALIWFGLWQFISYLKNSDKLHLLAYLAAFSLLIFVRIEALAFFAISVFILYRQTKSFKGLVFKTLGMNGLAIILLAAIVFIASLKINQPFYVTFLKGFTSSFESGENGVSSGMLSEIFYVLRVFSAYALLPYLVLSFVSFIYLLKHKRYGILVPFFILAPAFIYVFNPSITLDHPWMLRRYVFSIVPLGILFGAIFLSEFLKRPRLFYFFSFFLLLTNMLVFLPYIGVRENENLLAETKKLSAEFTKNDLILVDRYATGDPWSMVTGPMNLLENKQAVYFFNPDDLDKIDQSKFENIYLLVSDDNLNFYLKDDFLADFTLFKNYTIANNTLGVLSGKKSDLLSKEIALPPYQKNYIYGKIYLLKK